LIKHWLRYENTFLIRQLFQQEEKGRTVIIHATTFDLHTLITLAPVKFVPSESVEDDEAEADDAVAAEGGEHAFEVRAVDVRLQPEAHDREVADVVRTES
jgi:hypothetical protein